MGPAYTERLVSWARACGTMFPRPHQGAGPRTHNGIKSPPNQQAWMWPAVLQHQLHGNQSHIHRRCWETPALTVVLSTGTEVNEPVACLRRRARSRIRTVKHFHPSKTLFSVNHYRKQREGARRYLPMEGPEQVGRMCIWSLS